MEDGSGDLFHPATRALVISDTVVGRGGPGCSKGPIHHFIGFEVRALSRLLKFFQYELEICNSAACHDIVENCELQTF